MAASNPMTTQRLPTIDLISGERLILVVPPAVGTAAATGTVASSLIALIDRPHWAQNRSSARKRCPHELQ